MESKQLFEAFFVGNRYSWISDEQDPLEALLQRQEISCNLSSRLHLPGPL